MTEEIRLDAPIGRREAEVLERLATWLDDPEGLTDEQAEVVRHIVTHPESHRRDVNAIIEEQLTFEDLAAAFERTEPSTWGYPADSWDAARRASQLRTQTVLSAELAVVRALVERDHSREEIADRLGRSPAEVDDARHRIDRRIDAARRTLELLDR